VRLSGDSETRDFVTAIIQYYSSLAIEGENIINLWNETKQETRLQAERYEEHQRRQKNKEYMELEQQISYRTEKSEITEVEEEVVLNSVGTTLQDKFGQERNFFQFFYNTNGNNRDIKYIF
jgi:hypothetical protein